MMIIPRLERTLAYIISELEREEFYRLKKIHDKKKIARKEAEAIAAKLLEQGVDFHKVASTLDDGKDDILF